MCFLVLNALVIFLYLGLVVPRRRLVGRVAQSVEHWAFNLTVLGSNPNALMYCSLLLLLGVLVWGDSLVVERQPVALCYAGSIPVLLENMRKTRGIRFVVSFCVWLYLESPLRLVG